MAKLRRVKIKSVLESQIPTFIKEEFPLLREFLHQYYLSQEHNTGTIDLAANLTDFKNIKTYTGDVFHTENTKCGLTSDVLSFDDVINVNSTVGFVDKYGLIKINNEIITYTGITTNSFIGCSRGFSGISDIKDGEDSSSLVFSSTESEEHSEGDVVTNLNLLFYKKLFEKFKAHYLPDFEGRKFNSKADLELILSRAKDFYLTKGTDISFQILFELLYDDKISVLKPRDFLIRSSDRTYLSTRNILVELIDSDVNPLDLKLTGFTLFQDLPDTTTASASIYNIQYRPLENQDLFELSLDIESVEYKFVPTKKATIIDILDNVVVVDSTVGFSNRGNILIKASNLDEEYIEDSYVDKSLNEFIGISSSTIQNLIPGDVILENNLAYCILDSGELLRFRILNVIGEFDYSETYSINVNDTINLSTFGEDLSNDIRFNTWIYNYSTYHNIKNITQEGVNIRVEFFDSCKFYIGDEIYLEGTSQEESESSTVKEIISDKIIIIEGINILEDKTKVVKKIPKSSINSIFTSGIKNTYLDLDNDSLIVSSSGLPSYSGLEDDAHTSWQYQITKVGSATTSILTTDREHNFLSGNKLYLKSNVVGIASGDYFIRKISPTELSLHYSQTNLYKNIPIEFSENNIGIGIAYGYENLTNGFFTQKILKEFKPYINF